MSSLSSTADRMAPRAVVPQQELRSALAAGKLDLHYQPIVDIRSGCLRGVEALLRWHVPGGLLMPDDFLPAVAHTPAMRDLTSWVIDAACAQARRWPSWRVSINVAASDVARPELVDTVSAALRRHEVAPQALVLELTEHAAVQGMETAGEVLERLRRLGVGVALDDFGTGYSSLLYLRDLPITEVKIDRTFVSGVERLDDDAAIVESIVRLARNVGLDVVAEGVENLQQARFLRQIGCTFAQGYLFATPSAADDVPTEVARVLPARQARPTTARTSAASVSPTVRTQMAAMSAEGASLHTIAAALNHAGKQTPTGTRWSAASVARALRDSTL
jgi:EAL domain-containing protein (putative c-di-GMP-specific phosphodiesterase class I)